MFKMYPLFTCARHQTTTNPGNRKAGLREQMKCVVPRRMKGVRGVRKAAGEGEKRM